MQILDFLKGVLPGGTRTSLRFINGDKGVRRLYDEIGDKLEEDISYFISQGFNAYYCTAGFGAANTAKSENVVAKNELYIDVDCGKSKPYPDKTAGFEALKEFIEETHLPRPTIIDSGNGLHVHWFFSVPLPSHRWKELAEKLKDAHNRVGFKVDGACTADIVRVLRFPGSVNFKGGNTAEILNPIKYYDPETLEQKLDEYLKGDVNDEGDSPNPTNQKNIFKEAKRISGGLNGKAQPSELSKLLISNKTHLFQKIVEISLKDEGCAQIKYAVEHKTDLPEPLWRGMLSTAQYCEDRDWAIHEFSKGYPNYDPEETENKANGTAGPYTCETYEKMDQGELCKSCAHKGKIKAPIVLGAEIKKALEQKKEKVNGVEYEFPSLPFPYFFAEGGSIYMKQPTTKDGETAEDKLVYPNPLYIYKRGRESGKGDVCYCRLHLTKDGVREFTIFQRDIGALDRLRDRLSDEGVAAFNTTQLINIQRLFSLQIQDLQLKERAEPMNLRFGWTHSNTFVIGDVEYTSQGPRHSPYAKELEPLVVLMRPKGSLEEWKKATGIYNDPKYHFHAAGLLASFGSMLMHLSPEHGGVINFYSQTSGSGKTTILKFANSVWGQPIMLMKNAQDTTLSKIHRMGVLNGIVSTLDEMSNSQPEELSVLAYGSTQGRARDRMRSDANAERTNATTWKLISLWTSNSSVESRLLAYKMDPQGELARVLEIPITEKEDDKVLEIQKLVNVINDNYGWAGPIFAQYVVEHYEEVQKEWNDVRDVIYGMRKWTQTERYKLNEVVCIGTAGVICKKLGLLDYDIKSIIKSLIELVFDSAEHARGLESKATEIISQFINRHVQNVLVINDKQKVANLDDAPIVRPKGPLIIRYEPDTDTVYIAQRDFNKWCAEGFINTREIIKKFYHETKTHAVVTKKRMGKGYEVSIGAVTALEIKNAKTVLDMNVPTPTSQGVK